MKITVLGVGNVGSGIATSAIAAGHDVVVSASTPESAQRAASATGATASGSNREAVESADVVVLAVPHAAVSALADDLGDALAGKVVVDATNPLNDTYSGLTTNGSSAAEELQQQLSSATVVKALNTVFASRYADPREGGQPLDALVAGDDAAAKATVGELVQSLGFRPVDAGSLRMARSLEELAFLNISLNASNGWSWQSAFRLVGPQTSAA